MDDKNDNNPNANQSNLKPGGDSRVSETGKTGNEKTGQKTGQMGDQKSGPQKNGPKMSVAEENREGDMDMEEHGATLSIPPTGSAEID